MDSLVDDNFSEIRKTFTDPLYNAMGLHVDMGASFHDCGTRDDYGIGCCATLDGVTHYAKAWPIEDIESLPVGYYWCPDALDPDPSYNGYLLNVFVGFTFGGAPGKFFELFGGVTLNDVPSFGFDDGWDGSCLNRLDWFEDAVGMDADGLSAGLVANDAESVKALVGNCPAWIECFPSYSEKAAKGVDDVAQAVQAYRVNAKRVHSEVIPGYLYELVKTAAAKTAGGADGGAGPHI